MKEPRNSVLDAIERGERRASRRSWTIGLSFLAGLLLAGVLVLVPNEVSITTGTIEAVQILAAATGNAVHASVRLDSGRLVTAKVPRGSPDLLGAEVQLSASTSLFGDEPRYRVLPALPD